MANAKNKNKPTVPRAKNKTVSGASSSSIKRRVVASMDDIQSSPNMTYIKRNGINIANRMKREGVDLRGDVERGSDNIFNPPSRMNQLRLTKTLERTAHTINRDRIKKNFGEDIGDYDRSHERSRLIIPKQPRIKIRKPRNNAEAARKAAITRKRNGK